MGHGRYSDITSRSIPPCAGDINQFHMEFSPNHLLLDGSFLAESLCIRPWDGRRCTRRFSLLPQFFGVRDHSRDLTITLTFALPPSILITVRTATTVTMFCSPLARLPTPACPSKYDRLAHKFPTNSFVPILSAQDLDHSFSFAFSPPSSPTYSSAVAVGIPAPICPSHPSPQGTSPTLSTMSIESSWISLLTPIDCPLEPLTPGRSALITKLRRGSIIKLDLDNRSQMAELMGLPASYQECCK